jgi:hypothetical protein
MKTTRALGAAILLAALSSPVALAQPAPFYLDDRSTVQDVLRSYVNAVSLRQYSRAYSYAEPSLADQVFGPFDEFATGFAETDSVRVVAFGQVQGDAGAGQLFWSVPVTLHATLTDARQQWFFGCYQLHLAEPAFQTVPPYEPIGIRAAFVQQVGTLAEANAQLGSACAGLAAAGDGE